MASEPAALRSPSGQEQSRATMADSDANSCIILLALKLPPAQARDRVVHLQLVCLLSSQFSPAQDAVAETLLLMPRWRCVATGGCMTRALLTTTQLLTLLVPWSHTRGRAFASLLIVNCSP